MKQTKLSNLTQTERRLLETLQIERDSATRRIKLHMTQPNDVQLVSRLSDLIAVYLQRAEG